jgi:perosamine synthetase
VGPTPISIHRPEVGAPELDAVRRVLESRWLGSGPVTEAFEARIRDITGAAHAIAVSSGSAALHLALLALDLRPGDEVVLPSLTHVSGPQAVLAAGGVPVFCDVEPETANADPADVRRVVTSRTRAILPVHYAGLACRMDELLGIARERGLAVVEDAAHAFGSSYGTRQIGSLGDLTCFSFDPVKNVTCGEGGAVTTDVEALALAVRQATNLGVPNDSWRRRATERPWRYEATSTGFRYHLSDLNAAVGLAQLDRLEELRTRKRALLERYRAGLAGLDGLVPLGGDVASTFPFLCAVRVAGGRRDGLMEHLARDGIQAWVHFPPCHLQPAFARFGRSLPATEALYAELVTLPLHIGLSDADVDRVIASVRAFLEP